MKQTSAEKASNQTVVRTSDLRILGLGLGAALTTEEGIANDTAQRQIAYGAHFAEFVIVVKTPTRPDVYRPRYLDGTVRVLPTLSRGNLLALLSMIRIGTQLLQRQRFDVITVQEPFLSGTAGLWLRRRFAVPLQVQLHGDYLDNKYWIAERPAKRIFNVIGKEVVRRADTVRVVSHALEEYVLQRLGFPSERVVWCPVRVDLAIFESADGTRVRVDYAARGVNQLILFVGRFAKQKALGILLQAFVRVLEACPSTHLILVGDGPERENILRMAAVLGVAHAIELPGWLPLSSVAEYMAASDVLLLSSHLEGFGRVVVEASAAGIPSVATERAGPREIIRDGETGCLVPVNDPTALAEKVIYLLRHPQIAKQMGESARRLVRVKYDPARLIELNVESLRLTAELGLRK